MTLKTDEEITSLIQDEFKAANIPIEGIDIRHFPGELIAVVQVLEDHFELSLKIINNKIDQQIEDGFVTVKKIPKVKKDTKTTKR